MIARDTVGTMQWGRTVEAAPAPHEAVGAVITRVEAIPFRLPYARPGRFASGRIDVADNVLVRLHTDAGVIGQAEAQPRPYTYGGTQESIVASIRDELGPRLIGAGALRTELLAARAARPHTDRVARAALDVAAWDLAGLLLGVPSHRLLGGYCDEVAVAHMVSFDTPAAMAADAVEAHGRFGVETFKVKVGRQPELDVAAVRAIREALPAASLYVDANRGWTEAQARAALPGLLELGVRAVEEPIAADDADGRRRLAADWPVPIIGDESCISLAHVAAALDEGAVATVSVKAARTGFTESRRILGLCEGARVPVLVGSQYEGAVGAFASLSLAAAFPATAAQPAELTNFADLEADLVAAPPHIRGGRAVVPATPGLGFAVDDERLDFHRVDR